MNQHFVAHKSKVKVIIIEAFRQKILKIPIALRSLNTMFAAAQEGIN
jgi:hypothetical protein